MRPFLEPARHRRRMAVAHGPLKHRQGEPVDLEEDDPGCVGHDPFARAPRDSLHDPQRVHVVVVRPEQHGQDYADRSGGKGDAERRPEGVDRHARADAARKEQHPGVDEKHSEEADQGGEREPEGIEKGRQHRVEQGDERSDGQGRAEGRVRRAGDELRGDEQRHGAEQPPEHELPEPEARPLGRPARRLAVRDAHGAACSDSADRAAFLARRFSCSSACWRFASEYESETSCLPPPHPHAQIMRISAKRMAHAVPTSCCATEYAVASVDEATPLSDATFQACVTPTPPGVNEVTLASELPPATCISVSKLTGIPYAFRNTPTTASPASQLTNEGRKTRPRKVRGRLRIAPPSFALSHQATTCGQKRRTSRTIIRAPPPKTTIVAGQCSCTQLNEMSNEPPTDTKR